MNLDKDQRKYVRKNVYGFKVISNNIGSFTILFTGNITKILPMDTTIIQLFSDIEYLTFPEQFYYCKEKCEEYEFTFSIIDEKKYKNGKY